MITDARTAVELGKLSGVKRRERAEHLRTLTQAFQHAHIADAQTKAQQPDPYIAKRLARVRRQLNRLDSFLETESDPQKLDRLASAQMRLAEQERLLCGRPLPGSLKPLAKHDKRLSTQATFDSPLLPAEPIKPQVYDGPENG